MSRNACNGENDETGEKSPASGDLNWMPKVVPWRLAILAKMVILAKLAKIARGLAIIAINVPDPWRLAILAKMAIVAKLAILSKIARNACNGENGKKTASRWRFELDAKSVPLEAGDFGEIGHFGKNRQRTGDMWQNIQIGCQKWLLQSR